MKRVASVSLHKAILAVNITVETFNASVGMRRYLLTYPTCPSGREGLPGGVKAVVLRPKLVTECPPVVKRTILDQGRCQFVYIASGTGMLTGSCLSESIDTDGEAITGTPEQFDGKMSVES
jgi:hypothetical protein